MPNSTVGTSLLITRVPTALTLALATIVLAACGGGSEEAESGDDPGPEGITIYSGRIAPLIGPAIDMQEAETGTDIQTRFGDSPQLAATLVEEGESSRPTSSSPGRRRARAR